MLQTFLRLTLALWMAVFLGSPTLAQPLTTLAGPGSTAATAETEASDQALATAIRQAAEAGISVLVVDTQGRLLSLPDASTPQAQATASEPHGSALMQMQSNAEAFRATLLRRLEALPNSINEVVYILNATSPTGSRTLYLKILAWSLVLFAIGAFFEAEVFGKRLVKGFVVSRIREKPEGFREKMPFLVFRFLMGILGVLTSMVIAYVLGWLIFGSVSDLSVQFTVSAIYTAYFACRLVAGVWRMVLSPFLSQYRIPMFSDRDARRLFRWLWILATLDISAVMFSTWIHDFGLNYDVYALIYGASAGILSLGHIAMVLVNRRAISNAIRNGQPVETLNWPIRLVSRAWAPLLVGYIVFSFLELASDLVLERPVSLPLIFASYGVLTSMLIVYGVINYGIEQYFHRSRKLRQINTEVDVEIDPGSDAGAPGTPNVRQTQGIATYEQLARRVAGILAFVAGTFALLNIWDSENVVLGESLSDRALDVVVIIFIGYIVYNLFRIWIDTKIAEETVDEVEGELGDEGGATSASRLATLLPLFRNFILIVVVVTIGLIVLLELGINVSPLFAGAGVVGLAIGFGAQTLVRDIFSGAFFLIDDAFRKGEYIDIGDVKGTVEKISVRSFQLRHHLGALNTIPFGEIKVLTNYSRDWVIMKLPLRVTYDTDVEKVRKLIKKLGQDLLSDPVIGENFIQPLKSQGVIEMQDSAMIIRVKFMTKPGDQWLVRKRVYEDIRALFASEGIKFAHREVTVRLADEKADDLTPEQRKAVTGAVQAAIDEDSIEDINEGGDDR